MFNNSLEYYNYKNDKDNNNEAFSPYLWIDYINTILDVYVIPDL